MAPGLTTSSKVCGEEGKTPFFSQDGLGGQEMCIGNNTGGGGWATSITKKCLPLVGPENKQVQLQPRPGPYEGIQDFSHGSWHHFDHLTKGTVPAPRSSALKATHGPIQVLLTTPETLTRRKTVKDAIQEKGIQYCFC